MSPRVVSDFDFEHRLVLHTKQYKLKLVISTVYLKKYNFLQTKLNIGNMYIYQIEPLKETSWCVPISSLGDDRGERNSRSYPRFVPPLCSIHFSGESLFTTAGIAFTVVWAFEIQDLRTGEGPLSAKSTAMEGLTTTRSPSPSMAQHDTPPAWVPVFQDPLSPLQQHMSPKVHPVILLAVAVREREG